MNFIQKLFALIFPPSVSNAVAGIEKAAKNLANVQAHHAAQVVKHEAAIAKAAAKKGASEVEAALAAKVKDNISALLGKV